MPIPFRSSVPDSHPMEDELRWPKSERMTARKAFDRALNQELQEVMQQAKQIAAEIKQPSDQWGSAN